MTTKDTSGPAFPFGQTDPVSGQLVNGWGSEGMTLRQWYAGLAMQSLIRRGRFYVAPHLPHWTEQCQEEAFKMADAMLAEGNK